MYLKHPGLLRGTDAVSFVTYFRLLFPARIVSASRKIDPTLLLFQVLCPQKRESKFRPHQHTKL